MERTLKERRRREEDFCSRPLLKKIIGFTLPLILTGVLQLLYNASDIIVVGRFAGTPQECDSAMAAVGSTGALVNLITNLFLGLSVGALSAMARCVGAKDAAKAARVEHTAILLSVIGGIVIGAAGFFLSGYMLKIMSTPANVLPSATLYLRIYFLGMPFLVLYNFGASVMRACGDTKRPLVFLAFAGIANVGLNLLLVIVFHMSVAGVGIATITAQGVAAVLVVIWLKIGKRYPPLSFKKLKIHKRELIEIVKIGLPAGLQGTIFSLSNVVIQSSINGFGDVAMAGNAAASNIEGFVYVSMNSVSQACLTFIGQNYGADKHENINLILLQCTAIVVVVGAVLGCAVYMLGGVLCRIYNTNPEVVKLCVERLLYTLIPYCLCGVMEVLVGGLRGIGHSFMPMLVSVVGVCGLRIVWVFTLFRAVPTLGILYLSFPVSWAVTALVHLICYIVVSKKELGAMKRRRLQKEIAETKDGERSLQPE
ncbi:MAG: MATE family efflux transporter [Clostridia bacterium]|nr:MATE family efflux transporter [Clostridia bacterium]